MKQAIPGYLTTQEAARVLGVTRGRVHQLRRVLGAVECGNILLFPVETVRTRKRSKPKPGKPRNLKIAT